MKKTFTINISGTVFHIEDDAYEVLQKYLATLKKHFGSSEEGKEILSDIEARIAEIFTEKSTENKKVVTLDWVNEVIETMGTPEDFAEEEDAERPISEEGKRKRRLYRDPDSRVLGGVCGGLGAYFNMDPVVLRIIFVILFFATVPAVMIAYIILWIAVPKAATTAQRLEMRGQEATVKNIEKSIKEEVKEVKESYKRFKESDSYSKGKKTVEGAGDVIYNVFKVILKVFVVIVGAFLILSAFFGILGLISSLIIGHSFVEGWPLAWGPQIHIPNFLNHFVEPGTVTFGIIAVGFLTGIPLLAILFIGTKLVFRYKSNNVAIGLGMVGLWLISLFSLIVVSASQVGNYKTRSSYSDSETIECDNCNTLLLKLDKDRYDDYVEKDWEIDNFKVVLIDGKEVMLGLPTFDIEKAGADDFSIVVKKISRGRTRGGARDAAHQVVYNYDISDSTLVFDPYFFIEEGGKWRDQEVEITLKVPEGKTVYLGKNMIKIIHDIENVSNTWDGDMVEKYWEMTPEGLKEAEK